MAIQEMCKTCGLRKYDTGTGIGVATPKCKGNPMPIEKQNWEDIFDERYSTSTVDFAYKGDRDNMKFFIKTLLLGREKELKIEIREKLRKGGISSDCIYQDEIDAILSTNPLSGLK